LAKRIEIMKYIRKENTQCEAVQVQAWDFDLMQSIRAMSASDTIVSIQINNAPTLYINGLTFDAQIGDYIYFQDGYFHWMKKEDFEAEWVVKFGQRIRHEGDLNL